MGARRARHSSVEAAKRRQDREQKMKITDIVPGQIVKFTTRVEKSNKGQSIQEVALRVTEVNPTHIRGVNVNRILDGTQDTLPYRTYKVANIVDGTVWLRLDN